MSLPNGLRYAFHRRLFSRLTHRNKMPLMTIFKGVQDRLTSVFSKFEVLKSLDLPVLFIPFVKATDGYVTKV